MGVGGLGGLMTKVAQLSDASQAANRVSSVGGSTCRRQLIMIGWHLIYYAQKLNNHVFYGGVTCAARARTRARTLSYNDASA